MTGTFTQRVPGAFAAIRWLAAGLDAFGEHVARHAATTTDAAAERAIAPLGAAVVECGATGFAALRCTAMLDADLHDVAGATVATLLARSRIRGRFVTGFQTTRARNPRPLATLVGDGSVVRCALREDAGGQAVAALITIRRIRVLALVTTASIPVAYPRSALFRIAVAHEALF